jgi:REP element-mobilizing transposase RayT
MDELESLNHSKWECKYHVVFTSVRLKAKQIQLI